MKHACFPLLYCGLFYISLFSISLHAETFFNPLKIPDLKISNHQKDVVYLGRLGRKDSFIFDPISIQAFRKIEDEEIENQLKKLKGN